MKNLHVIPTDKPSRIKQQYMNMASYALSRLPLSWRYAQHIYITSDEEIKDDEWHLHNYKGNPVIGKSHNSASEYINLKAEEFGYNKIILTTDQDLIKDGVQAIDDEFLEWFIDNPSCEEVEIEVVYETGNIHQNDGFDNYKIIILKEELERGMTITHIGKQDPLEEEDYSKILKATMVPKEYFGTKQETLEDAAENYSKKSSASVFQETHKRDFIKGAEYQAERMYSEEEVLELLLRQPYGSEYNIKAWFEQFKKK